MKRVILESPYAGDVERNVEYARRAMLDSLKRGEAPFLSHLLYTQVLEDTEPYQRQLGTEAGWSWIVVADGTVVYEDYGISDGMVVGIECAAYMGNDIEYRTIGENPAT